MGEEIRICAICVEEEDYLCQSCLDEAWQHECELGFS